jgi:hypothetical protein
VKFHQVQIFLKILAGILKDEKFFFVKTWNCWVDDDWMCPVDGWTGGRGGWSWQWASALLIQPREIRVILAFSSLAQRWWRSSLTGNHAVPDLHSTHTRHQNAMLGNNNTPGTINSTMDGSNWWIGKRSPLSKRGVCYIYIQLDATFTSSLTTHNWRWRNTERNSQ